MGTISINLIRLERRQRYLSLRLSRPDRYNALDAHTLRTLADLLAEHRATPMPLILEGDAEIFSVGADISELAVLDASQAQAYSQLGHQVIAALEDWPGVTLASLSGYALGAGLELALGCDLLVGTPDVRLGLPGLAWALVPCMGGLRRLACRVSEEFSSEFFLNGDVIDGSQALENGLLDRVISQRSELLSLAARMAEYSPSAVQAVRSLRLQRHGTIDTALGARMFSQPFVHGECQRRLKHLLQG